MASPVQQELCPLAKVATIHELCISICRDQLFNWPNQIQELPVN